MAAATLLVSLSHYFTHHHELCTFAHPAFAAGAAVIAFALLGVFSEHKHPHLIHWFARECSAHQPFCKPICSCAHTLSFYQVGAFIIAAFSTVKAAVFAFRGKGRSHLLASSDSGERAPLVR